MPVNRLEDWSIFSNKVATHIEKYTIPQYQTPEGDDQVMNFDSADCVQSMKRYLNRYSVNARGEMETLRDFIKIAHYAQFAYDKFRKERNLPDVY